MNRIARLNFKETFEHIRREPVIVAFLSGKGGVGKSVVTYNVAAALSGMGKRVLLIDAVWDFGSQHLLANINPDRTLADIVDNQSGLDESAVVLRENFRLVASPSAQRSDTKFVPQNYRGFLKSLKEANLPYDLILLDTPSSHLEIIRDSVAVSDVNLMVINPELTSMANSYGLYKFLMQSVKGFNAHIFVNRVEFGKDSEYMYQKFAVLSERFLGQTPFYAGYLHDNREITDSIMRQKAVVDIAPESETAAQILNLCKFLTKEMAALTDNRMNAPEPKINSRTNIAEIKG